MSEQVVKSSPFMDAFWGNIFNRFSNNVEQSQVDILGTIPLFKELSRRELSIVSKITYERTYEVGEYMFEAGQPGAAMFIVKDGELQIIRQKANGDEIELARLRSGEFLGELALLDNSPRSASAFVTKPTKALAIFRADLEKLLDTYPEVGGKVMKRLAVIIGLRLKVTNDMIVSLEDQIEKLQEAQNATAQS